jgi:hypothetical protein
MQIGARGWIGVMSTANFQIRHHLQWINKSPLACRLGIQKPVKWMAAVSACMHACMNSWRMRSLHACTHTVGSFLRCSQLAMLPSHAYMQMIARRLSRVMMVGMEVALEVWQSLTQTPLVQWLDYAGDMGTLLREELDQQAELVRS